jgi:hypothetical protein
MTANLAKMFDYFIWLRIVCCGRLKSKPWLSHISSNNVLNSFPLSKQISGDEDIMDISHKLLNAYEFGLLR